MFSRDFEMKSGLLENTLKYIPNKSKPKRVYRIFVSAKYYFLNILFHVRMGKISNLPHFL